MKILQSNLKRGLDTVGRTIPSHPALPVLSHTLVSIEGDVIRMTGTNLEMFVRCQVAGRPEPGNSGTYALPYRLFSDLVKALPDETVDLQVDDGTVSVSCGRTNAHVNSMDGDEFPRWNEGIYSLGAIMAVEPYALKTALEAVAYAAATDESRPVLTAVLFRFETGKLSLAAADGFRLAMYELQHKSIQPEEPRAILVPAETIKRLLQLLPTEGEPVEVFVDGDENGSRLVFFRIKGDEEDGVFDIELVSSLVEGRFIDYGQIVPKSHKTRIVTDRKAFETAIRRAQIFARYEAHLVHLYVEPEEGKIVFSATSAEMGEHKGEIDAEIDGERLHVAFNTAFLRDAVSSMPHDDVVLELNDRTRPVTLRPAVEDKCMAAVVMPMHIVNAEVEVVEPEAEEHSRNRSE